MREWGATSKLQFETRTTWFIGRLAVETIIPVGFNDNLNLAQPQTYDIYRHSRLTDFVFTQVQFLVSSAR